ncbi:MAG TPA: transglutaminase-like domain-containing protein [Thermoanaerobaculia bacterium]|nr:transglutaminase-like domain-containing protein [Thermoanaerobaculia bacterium]
MLFHNRRLKAGTAVVVLAALVWMSSGGETWALTQAARRDPAKVLLRLADDPRLALSREERDYVRRYVRRMEEKPVRVEAPVGDHPVEPAAEMRRLGEELAALAASADHGARPEKAAQAAKRLEAIHRRVLRDLDDTEARARAANLPQVILDRHEAAKSAYLEEVRALFAELEAGALTSAMQRLRRSTAERPGGDAGVDPSRLPFRRAEPVKRQPGASVPGQARASSITGIAESLTPPTPADLAETEDVQITPEIRALAASLGNRPTRIYEWVRNNVEHYPTYGSVQGSQMTLDAKRGNAFDTASLLIALLRAAGVPARYVTGTVQVPVDLVLNWVGGAATPNVAQQLLGQGGVPNVALTSGGTVTHIRLDHVWVEAFVDNIPSRGAVQREGDTWVPMDAAFKQYQLQPRSALFAANPIGPVQDPAGVMDVDESLGRVTNVNRQALDDRVIEWVLESDQFINSNGVPRTHEGLLGGKTIVPQTSAVLPASLPYEVVQRGSAVSSLPAGLRHTVTVEGFATPWERALGDPSFSVRLSLPQLNSRRLGIQFNPATQADADTLAAARNGGASSLPVYLVRVVPAVKLDGTVLGSGASVQMGSSYLFDVVFQGPDGPTRVPYEIVAGDEIVVGITGNGVAPEVAEKRFNANPVDNAAEYLHQVQLHYWMETDYLGELAARGAGVHQLRLPSVGFFSSPLTVSYFFGAPRSGIYQSRIMDVKHSLMGAAGEDPARVIDFMKQAGVQGSYLEGAVFDQLETINAPAAANRGISAIHLLTSAMGQGIPIYRITSANAAAAVPQLQLSAAVESDISRAVSQGKTVIVSERNLDLGNWMGVGYIIHDEASGAGAYLISGGLNGGGIIECVWELVPIFILVLLFIFFLIRLILLLAALIGAIATAPAWGTAAAAALLLLLIWQGVSSTSPAPTSA